MYLPLGLQNRQKYGKTLTKTCIAGIIFEVTNRSFHNSKNRLHLRMPRVHRTGNSQDTFVTQNEIAAPARHLVDFGVPTNRNLCSGLNP
jgi:hypothetical protein